MAISTDLHVRNAAPINAERTDYPVDGSPGLVLRVASGGDKTWSLRYRRQSDGKLRRLTIGSYPDTSLKQARELAAAARREASQGADPQGDKRERREAGTFRDLGQAWLTRKIEQGRSRNYTSQMAGRLALLPKWFLELKPHDIERLHVARALDDAAKRGQGECNQVHSLLSAIGKWGLSEGLVARDPSAGVKKRFAAKARERVWTDDELRAIWKGIDTLPATAGVKIALRLCIVTGQRPNEIASLQRSLVTMDALRPAMTIARETAKNRTEHVVPLPRLAVELMREAQEIAGGSAWVFPSPGGKGPIDPHALSKAMARGRAGDGSLLGVKDAQLYDARKAVATWLGNQGHPDAIVALLLNQISTRKGNVTGRHYNHATYIAQKRSMIEAWAAHLESVVGIERETNVVELNVKRGA
jgi:integrase